MEIKLEYPKAAILNAILSVPPLGWEGYFETFRQQQYKKLVSATSEEQRLEIQIMVKAINNIEDSFKRTHDTKKLA